LENSIVARKLIFLALSIIVASCAAEPPRRGFWLADFLSIKELPYDSPPQVIYRIDDHRFITLEHYRDCNHGDTYYNDTVTGVRKYLARGTVENYQGRVINADPTGKNLVVPGAEVPEYVCGDRGCNPVMMYSTDSGRTFYAKSYVNNSFDPFKYSKDFTIAATKDAIYVTEKLGETTSQTTTRKYLINPDSIYLEREKLPDGAPFVHSPPAPTGLRTPSGQDRYTCDASIKPTNPDAPLVKQ
jgi:hypothetical protein